MADAAEAELLDDVVTIDPDDLRDYHPRLKEFQSANPYTWSGRTHADAGQWADELREAAVAGKKNFIFDTTLSNGQWTADLIKDLQAKGYEVEVRAVAAHKLESELGVDQRFTDKIDDVGHGRYVPAGARDAIYGKVPASLDTIHAQTDVPIRIFTREGKELYDSRSSTRAPKQVLEEAREARLHSVRVTRSLDAGWQEQQAWHRDLPDALPQNRKVAPETAQHLLHERRQGQVAEAVTRYVADAHGVYQAGERGLAAKGLGAAGVVATGYEVADTLHDVNRLRGQGNAAAAQERITRFATQNLGGWGGAVAGAGLGAAAGVETGPGLLVTGALGGIVGAVAGDKAADWMRDARINHQTDHQGNTWSFDPDNPARGWTRRELDLDAMRYSAGVPVYKPGELRADAALSDELTYKASSKSVELALGMPPQGRDPYRLAPNAAEQAQRTPFETGRAWHRDPQTQQWQQDITTVYDGRARMTHREPASPERAAELEQQSQVVIAENASRTPAAMAAQYQAAYERNGWSQHGPMPDAVQEAKAHPGRIIGSDGDLYERGGNGQWTHDGLLWDSQAHGNLKQELDATYQQQQQILSIKTLETVSVRPEAEVRQQAPTTAPEQASPRRQDPLLEQYLAALNTGDEQSIRTAAKAYATDERWQQTVAWAEQHMLAKQQQLPGRDNPLFAQAMTQLERLGPQAGGYLDRVQREQVAGAVAYQARLQHLPSIDALTPIQGGRSLLATSTNPNNPSIIDRAVIDKTEARMQPLDQSLQQLTAETQRQQDQALLQAQQRAEAQQQGFSR